MKKNNKNIILIIILLALSLLSLLFNPAITFIVLILILKYPLSKFGISCLIYLAILVLIYLTIALMDKEEDDNNDQ